MLKLIHFNFFKDIILDKATYACPGKVMSEKLIITLFNDKPCDLCMVIAHPNVNGICSIIIIRFLF